MKYLVYVLKTFAVVLGILILVPAAMITYDRFSFSDMIPPSSILTIAQFREWQPTYITTYRTIVDGTAFYIITGEYARSLASSRSEYYFDSNGIYVNWNRDPGDLVTMPIVHRGERVEINIDEIGQ